jgi:hypothetical protein
LLMLCLSFPAFGGHTVSGGKYCDPCGIGDCACDGTGGNRANTNQVKPSSDGSEMLLSLFVLLMLLRYRG